MDDLDENIQYQSTNISEQEMLAVFTLMGMLKRKREATTFRMSSQNTINADKYEIEIKNETNNKQRRCHSLQDVNMINTISHPDNEATYEENCLYNDVSSQNSLLISSHSTVDIIDGEQNKNDKNIKNSVQSFSTDHSSTQQKGIRELVSLFNFSDYYYQSPSTLHTSIFTFNKRNSEQEKQILTEYQTKGFDEEDLIYLQSGFHSLVKEHSLRKTLRWVDHSTSIDLSDSCARTRPWTRRKIIDKSTVSCWSSDSCLSTNSNKTKIDQRTILTNVHKEQFYTNHIRQKRQTINSNINKQSVFNIHGLYQPHNPVLSFDFKYRSHHLHLLKSSIHGFGVFTSETIQIGELIIEYVGEIIRSTVADLRDQHSLNGNYMFRIDRDTIIDANRFGNISRFLNHSCTPNCSAKIIHKNLTNDCTHHIVIYAKRTINPYEELTYDYKYDETNTKLKCLCHSEHCLGCI